MANGRSSACTTAEFLGKSDAPPVEPLDAADSNGIMGSFDAMKDKITRRDFMNGVAVGNAQAIVADLRSYHWQSRCRGLYHLPVAA